MHVLTSAGVTTKDFDYRDFLIHQLPFNYEPTASLPYKYESKVDCPTIKAWLLKAVNGDVDTVTFLRAWLAALLHGRADLQNNYT